MTPFEYPEGATPIDADEAEGLLLTHVTTRAELDRWEQENIIEALDWLARTKPGDILNEPFIKSLHRHMFGHVWKWAGDFRQSEKNIGGPWHQVPMSVRKLCDDVRLWIELREDSPDEMAVRLHHRLVSIHPFANGNGRHSRLMADLFLEDIMAEPRFSWGSKDLSAPGNARRTYIAALHAADEQDYGPLLQFART